MRFKKYKKFKGKKYRLYMIHPDCSIFGFYLGIARKEDGYTHYRVFRHTNTFALYTRK